MNCCDSLLLSTTSPTSPALLAQDEKFGVYRLQYVDRSPSGQGRATFKHIERDLFLYYVSDHQIDGWIVGPKPGVSLGGLFWRVRQSYLVLLLKSFLLLIFFELSNHSFYYVHRTRLCALNMQMGMAKCGSILTKTIFLGTLLFLSPAFNQVT